MKKTKLLLVMAILTSISCSASKYFWVGGSGNWSDFSNHWATTSGGNIFHNQVPQSTDHVFFDVNSFSTSGQTVTIDQSTVQCADMTWTGLPTTTPTLAGDSSQTLRIHGSLVLLTGMAFNFNGQLIMEATTIGKTLSSGGTTINTSLTFNGAGGAWTLQDALKVTRVIYLNNGSLNTNNQTVNASAFYSNSPSIRSLVMGASIFNLKGDINGIWNVNPLGMTLNAGTSTINGTSTIGSDGSFYGGGLSYNNLSFANPAFLYGNNTFHDVAFISTGYINGNNHFHDVSFFVHAFINGNNTFNNVTMGGNGTISSSNTFNNLSFSPWFTYTLQSGQTQTVGNICARGTGALPIRIQASNAGIPAIISKVSGTICWDYVRVSDITATGGAVFNAGLAPTNSQDLGGNTGLLFTGGCTAVSCLSTCTPPSITLNPLPSTVCGGSTASFTITATGTDLSYQWQVNPGAGFTNLVNSSLYSGVTTNTLNITGATTVLNGNQYRCAAVGVCPLVSMSEAATLSVKPSPIVTVNSAAICAGQTAILTATIGSNMMDNFPTGTETYAWSTGATTSSISVSPAISTNYTVIVTRDACSTKTIATVTMNPLPIVNAGQDATVISNTSVQLGTAPVSSLNYSWSPATGLSNANVSNPILVLQNNGSTPQTYTYILAATNGQCSKTDTVLITILTNCVNAVSFANTNSSIYNNTLSGIDKWFSFVADSTTIIIQEFKDSTSANYIQRMELYSGTCSNLALIDSAEITLPYDNVLTLYETNLTIGNTYYIRTLRSGTISSNANFDLHLHSVLLQTICSTCATDAISQSCDLVCNGNFEFNTALPVTLGNNSGYDPIGGICSWQNGSYNGTSDYFNYNATNTDVKVPVNYSGTQTSMNAGNAYAGIIAYANSPFIVWGPNYHEYISQKLISQLLPGHTYRATMWVSLAEKSGMAVENLGMYFSSGSTYNSAYQGYSVIAVTPQIKSLPLGAYITDETNWVKITGIIPGNGEQWLTIGSFNNNHQFVTNSTSVSGRGAYYYIDEVSVIEEDPAFTVTPGTPICKGQSEPLTASGAVSYLWSPGGETTSSITVSPATTTTYTVAGTDASGCERTLTTTVTVYPIPNVASPLEQICLGEFATLFANGAGITTYTWAPGSLPNMSHVYPLTTTTYTVTESLHGCTSTKTVYVNQPPTVTISGSPSICPGGSTTLTASGATSYYWSPAVGLSNQNIANPIATPTITTTYTVTGVDNTYTQCSNTATVTITVKPAPTVNPISNTIVSACSTTPLAATTFTSTPAGTTTYTWTNSSTGIGLAANGTGSVPAFIATNSTTSPITATITVTGTLNGCIGTPRIYTITVNPCCVYGTHTFVDGNNSASMFGQYGASPIINKQFSINGTFTVNQSMTWDNCDVRLGIDAIINITNGAKLTITGSNCHLYACNNMWKGIQIQFNSTLDITKNALIEDAKTAVLSINGGKYNLDGARLNRNYKHMDLTAYTGIHSGLIKGSQFTCQAIPPGTIATLSDPYSGQRTSIGIDINKVNLNGTGGVNIGLNGVLNTNTFKNMDIGIRCVGSSVSVYNNNFTTVNDGVPQNAGAAIVATGNNALPAPYVPCKLIVGDGSAAGMNTFKYCTNGIVTFQNMNVQIKWNDFNNIVSRGVYVFLNKKNNSVDIWSNVFKYMGYGSTGIHCQYLAPGLIKILKNEMDNFGKYSTGVLLEEINNMSVGALYTVYNNKISKVQYGIRAHSLNNASISNNYIQTSKFYPPPPNGSIIGIEVQGSYGTKVTSNDVKIMPTSSTNTQHGGIYASLSVNSDISCNTTANMGYGIKCAGPMPSNIFNNSITNDFYGFWLDNNGFVGIQDGTGPSGYPSYNKWINIPGKRTYTSNNTFGSSSKIYYRSPGPNSYEPFPSGIASGTGAVLFAYVSTSNGNVASPNCTVVAFHRSSTLPHLLKNAQDIALDNINFPANDANAKWLNKQGLLVNIKTDSIDVSSDGILQGFVNQSATDNLGKLTELNNIILDPEKYNSTDMLAAQALNAAVSPANDIETNQKQLNDIIINNYLSNTTSYTTAQLNDLRILANKCPFTDGLAVYQARVMLSGTDTLGTEYYNACETWDDGTRELYTDIPQNEDTTLMVFPNPATNQLTVNYQVESTDVAVFEIYNLIGEKVLFKTLNEKENIETIDITALNSGVYFYKYSINTIVSEFNKLIIVK